METIDLRAEATELFVQAAAQIAMADIEQLEGPQILLPRLLALKPGDSMHARALLLGQQISDEIATFLRDIGESELAEDLATIGFVACAALGLAQETKRQASEGDLPL